jgi:hypothetical protein
MKVKISALFLGLFFLASSVASALPIIPTNIVSEWKLRNYENYIDVNQSGTIDAGDKIVGIMKVTSIGDIGQNFSTWQQNSGQGQIAGDFQLTVTGGSLNPTPGSTGDLSFALQTGDFFNLYFGNAETWDGTVANAITGNPWLSITPADFYQGVNNSTGASSLNYNWADISPANNNTGYAFVPQDWPTANGTWDLGYSGGILNIPPNTNTTQIYWESKLSPLANDPNGWAFSSQDPLNVYATPEPATMALLGLGLIGMACVIRRKRSIL